MPEIVHRPVVRSFTWPHRDRAAAYVRRGGHAVLWETPRRAWLVVPRPRPGDEHDLGWWSMLDLGESEYEVVPRGILRGLARMRIPRDCHGIVRHRAERDSIFEGPTKPLELDCLACGACCLDNEVVLEAKDLERFAAAKRAELARRPWAKKKDGKVILVLARDKRCKHLAKDNKCAIYAIRPDACSTFPAGSECCLFSREDVHGIVDGLSEG